MKEALSCKALRARGGWREDAALHRCAFPIGPRNTVSNLAYLLAGIWLLQVSDDPMRFAMAAFLCLLAVGSAGYHGTKRTFWNNMDWAGMYSTMTVLVIHGINPNVPGGWLGGFSVGIVGACLFAFQVKHVDLLMGGLFLVAAIPPIARGGLWAVLPVVLLFALGYLAWQADKRRWKFIGLYGHALWHVLTAVALALLFVVQG